MPLLPRKRADGAIGSCGDLSSIVLHATATDNATPSERMGFRVRVVDGVAPISVPDQNLEPESQDEMRFFMDGSRGFAFTLEVRAVDLNGNLGPPAMIYIEDEPDDAGGCATGRERDALGLVLAIGAISIAMRRRR